MPLFTDDLTAISYLSHAYAIPKAWPALPLEDEPFLMHWSEAEGAEALNFLNDSFHLNTHTFSWERPDDIEISFSQTMAGRIPVITTVSHKDFRSMASVFAEKTSPLDVPPTVNAFTLQKKNSTMSDCRVILLNRAPYSNIPAGQLELSEDDWIERSHRLRLRHECAHYETLRLLGAMKNHAHDEILADALGQLAAFGSFSADRQRLFFGIEHEKNTCSGRLSFYCRMLSNETCETIYHAVDLALDAVERHLISMQKNNAAELDIFAALAGTSIAEW